MREEIFEQTRLTCPRCRCHTPLRIEEITKKEGDYILEGILICSSGCKNRFPILSGVPIVLRNLEIWNSSHHLNEQLLRIYLESHYASNAEVFWKKATDLIQPVERNRAIDLGCSTGRYSFELAKHFEVVVGVDLDFKSLRAAAKIQRTRKVSFKRKTHGNDTEEICLSFPAPQNVLFVLGDSLDPPFECESFDLVAGLNLLDCVKVPLILISQMDALLREKGNLLLCSPYEWRPEIVDQVEWLENAEMDSPEMVRNILESKTFPELELNYEILQDVLNVPWIMRQHNRHWILFLVHFIAARKKAIRLRFNTKTKMA